MEFFIIFVLLVLTAAVVLGLPLYLIVRLGRRLRATEDRLLARIAALTRRVYALDHSLPEEEPEPVPIPTVAAPPPAEPLPEPAPRPPDRRDWEAILGGNWLNKIGAAAVVIGIALFTGYAFTLMGPAGRIALSGAVSLLMLAGGALLEPRKPYRVLARSLIAGGWAGLYVSAYAAHGVAAARIIESPLAGLLLLVAVSAAMVLHSLRYHSEIATGLAYAFVFLSLALTSLSIFALAASVPLVLSVVLLAHRLNWRRIPLPALLAAYALYALQAAKTPDANLFHGQLILTLYWLLYESLDIAWARRGGPAALLFPANALCWTILSWTAWNHLAPDSLYRFFILAAALYSLSAAVRAAIVPPAETARNWAARLAAGGYAGPLALAALSGAGALVTRLDGLPLVVALLTEAEIVYLAGLAPRWRLGRWLGNGLFAWSVLRLLGVVISEAKLDGFAGWGGQTWTGPALLAVAIFYGNRTVLGAKLHSIAATLLVVLVIFGEVPTVAIGVSLVALAFVLAAAGARGKMPDLPRHSYVVSALGVGTIFAVNVFGLGLTGAGRGLPWWPLAAATLALYSWAAVAWPKPSGSAASAAGTALALAWVHNVLPLQYGTLGWAALGFALLALGLSRRAPLPRYQAFGIALLTFFRAAAFNLTATEGPFAREAGVLVIATLFASQLLCEMDRAKLGGRLERRAAPAYSGLASLLLAGLLYENVSGSMLTVAWGVQSIATLAAGFGLRNRPLRLTGLGLLLVCTGKLFFYDLRNLETMPRILSFVVLGLMLIAASWVYTRFRERTGKSM